MGEVCIGFLSNKQGPGLRGSLEMFHLENCERSVEPEKVENILNRKTWQIIVTLLSSFDAVKYFHLAVLFRCVLMLQVRVKH